MTWDVIVAGAGNAGLCAARERGRRVLVLEKADEAWSGGNSAFTAGAIRLAHRGLEDVRGRLSGLRARAESSVVIAGALCLIWALTFIAQRTALREAEPLWTAGGRTRACSLLGEPLRPPLVIGLVLVSVGVRLATRESRVVR